jgi:dATP pyrophosphohydrolase
VLVVVHTRAGRVLMLRRREPADFWQSVTGSLGWEETAPEAARRELSEETGIEAGDGLRDLGIANRFPIIEPWRRRYAPEVKENTEYVYSLALPAESAVILSPAEHTEAVWLDWRAAAERATSWTNREAILALAKLENW